MAQATPTVIRQKSTVERKMIKREWEHAEAYGATDPDCWIWNGERGSNKYGRFGKKRALAHVVSYHAFKGPISEGTIDHLCQKKKCVNPDHLANVSQDENNRRHREFKDTPD